MADSVCCPFLEVRPCGDTASHAHPACAAHSDVLANKIVLGLCVPAIEGVETWKSCPDFQKAPQWEEERL